MSESLGPIAHTVENESFLGSGYESRNYSEETAQLIDLEVKTIIEAQYARVQVVLEENREAMHRVVTVLMERESLTGEEFQMVLDGQELPPFEAPEPRRDPLSEEPERPAPPVLRPSRA
jgi:cell division protease FtsH